jgi:hypothetical protein
MSKTRVASLSLVLLPASAWAWPASLGFPLVPGGFTYRDFGTSTAVIAWNSAGSVPTAYSIEPAGGSGPLMILPPVASTEEAGARIREFIDANFDMFQVRSEDLIDFHVSEFHATAFRFGALQGCRGIPVEGAGISFDVSRTGELGGPYGISLYARLFPAVDLAAIDLEPSVSREEAFAIVFGGRSSPQTPDEDNPDLRIIFVSGLPTLTWRVIDGAWSFYISARTGEVLGLDGGPECIVPPCPVPWIHLRGEVDGDGAIDLSDPIGILGFLFIGEPDRLGCEKSADANIDDAVDLSDGVYLLSYLFLGGPAPAAPFPSCGTDLTDALPCYGYSSCW